MDKMTTRTSSAIVVLFVVLLIAVGGYAFFTMTDGRTGVESLGNTVREAPMGLDNTAQREESGLPPADMTPSSRPFPDQQLPNETGNTTDNQSRTIP